MTINWSQSIQQIIDAHDDLLEVTSELQKWASGESGGTAISSVTFDFSDGNSYTYGTIPELVANSGGSQSIETGVAVSNGDRVKIYDDGGSAKIRPLQASVYNSSYEYDANADIAPSICYDSDNDVGVVFFQESTANEAQAKIFQITSAITYGSAQTVATATSGMTYANVTHCSGDSTSGTILFTWIDQDDSDKIRYKIGTSDGTTITMGSEGDVGSSVHTAISSYVAKYDSTNNMIVIAAYQQSSDYDIILKYGTVDGSAKSITWSTDETVLNDIAHVAGMTSGIALALDESNANAYVGYMDSSDDYYIRRYATYNAVISAKTAVNVYSLGSSDFDTFDFKYDSGNDQLILFTGWETGTAGSVMTFHLKYDTANETAFEIKRNTLGNYNSGILGVVQGQIDIANNKLYYFSGAIASTPVYVYEYEFNFTDVQVIDFNSYNEILGSNSNNIIAIADNLVFFTFYSEIASKYADEREKFAGIAQGNYTAGATATVSIVGGGISTANSGLSIGEKYYLQTDTSLGTTKNSFPIGLAIDSNNLKLI